MFGGKQYRQRRTDLQILNSHAQFTFVSAFHWPTDPHNVSNIKEGLQVSVGTNKQGLVSRASSNARQAYANTDTASMHASIVKHLCSVLEAVWSSCIKCCPFQVQLDFAAIIC